MSGPSADCRPVFEPPCGREWSIKSKRLLLGYEWAHNLLKVIMYNAHIHIHTCGGDLDYNIASMEAGTHSR